MIKSFRNFVSKNYSLKRNFASSLYTWGSKPAGLGFSLENPAKSDDFFYQPTKLAQFDDKIKKVSMGTNHTAVVTSLFHYWHIGEGKIFTFGSNKHGALGIDSNDTIVDVPQMVEFFKSKNISIADVACGDNFTIALTSDGDVYTFGYGGESKLSFLSSKFNTAWGIGNGVSESAFTPYKVEQFNKNVAQISASERTATILTKSQEVYNWGDGKFGAFGNNSVDSQYSPLINLHLKNLVETQGSKIKKIKSAGFNSSVLLGTNYLI